jgi:hypothetical protein
MAAVGTYEVGAILALFNAEINLSEVSDRFHVRNRISKGFLELPVVVTVGLRRGWESEIKQLS